MIDQVPSEIDISVIVTLHREGILAHASLISICQSISSARSSGVMVELIIVLDNADAKTTEIVEGHPRLDGDFRILHVTNGDLALSRHSGIAVSRGAYISLVDGDDIVSRDYFQLHFERAAALDKDHVLHPEMVISFGQYNAFNWQVDQAGQYFHKPSLLKINPWISAAFAHRSVFERVPQVAIDTRKTGFGFEDWNWNCETIAKGMVHRLAPGTAYFYRRKFVGSMNKNSLSANAVMPPNSLFDSSLVTPEDRNRD